MESYSVTLSDGVGVDQILADSVRIGPAGTLEFFERDLSVSESLPNTLLIRAYSRDAWVDFLRLTPEEANKRALLAAEGTMFGTMSGFRSGMWDPGDCANSCCPNAESVPGEIHAGMHEQTATLRDKFSVAWNRIMSRLLD